MVKKVKSRDAKELLYGLYKEWTNSPVYYPNLPFKSYLEIAHNIKSYYNFSDESDYILVESEEYFTWLLLKYN